MGLLGANTRVLIHKYHSPFCQRLTAVHHLPGNRTAWLLSSATRDP